MMQVKQIMNNLRTIGNPQAMLTNMANTKPELKKALSASNGDFQKAFYDYADRMGINPNEIINSLKRP